MAASLRRSVPSPKLIHRRRRGQSSRNGVTSLQQLLAWLDAEINVAVAILIERYGSLILKRSLCEMWEWIIVPSKHECWSSSIFVPWPGDAAKYIIIFVYIEKGSQYFYCNVYIPCYNVMWMSEMSRAINLN